MLFMLFLYVSNIYISEIFLEKRLVNFYYLADHENFGEILEKSCSPFPDIPLIYRFIAHSLEGLCILSYFIIIKFVITIILIATIIIVIIAIIK